MANKNKANLSGKASDLYKYLTAYHLGKNQGIFRPDLAVDMRISTRELRRLTQEINSSMEFEGIVSTTHCCYLCATKEECEATIRNTYKMAITLFKKAKTMEKKVGLNGQIKMTLGEDYNDFVETFKE